MQPKTVDEYKRFIAKLQGCKDNGRENRNNTLSLSHGSILPAVVWLQSPGLLQDHGYLDRCKEVQANPDGHLDLWAREHYKSTIITYGKTIQDVLASHGENPLSEWRGEELTVGFFSVTRPLAKGFLAANHARI
jgi:hypothetical protein